MFYKVCVGVYEPTAADHLSPFIYVYVCVQLEVLDVTWSLEGMDKTMDFTFGPMPWRKQGRWHIVAVFLCKREWHRQIRRDLPMCVLAASKWRQLFHQAHKWLYYEVLIDCMLCGHGYKQMFKHCTNNVGCYSVCEGCQHRDVRVCLCVAMAVSLWIDAGQLKFGSLWCWWAVESSHLTAHQCDRAFSHSLSFLVSLSHALPLSICLLLTSSPSFSSLCPPSLSLPLLPNWLRKPEWLSDPECTEACVCVCFFPAYKLLLVLD